MGQHPCILDALGDDIQPKLHAQRMRLTVLHTLVHDRHMIDVGGDAILMYSVRAGHSDGTNWPRGTARCGRDDDLTGDTTQRLLDAMDGTALVLDADLRILRIGRPNWTRFLEDNRGRQDASVTGSIAATLGQPITAVMAGERIPETFAALFLSVLHGRRNAVRLEHRCDSPALRRDMRLSVTPIETVDAGRHLLYQSVLLSAEARPPIPLFGAEVVADDAPDVLTLCSICARVAWPPGAAPERREWIEPAEYYRRDGAEVVSLSHGLCESCFDKLTEDYAA